MSAERRMKITSRMPARGWLQSQEAIWGSLKRVSDLALVRARIANAQISSANSFLKNAGSDPLGQ